MKTRLTTKEFKAARLFGRNHSNEQILSVHRSAEWKLVSLTEKFRFSNRQKELPLYSHRYE